MSKLEALVRRQLRQELEELEGMVHRARAVMGRRGATSGMVALHRELEDFEQRQAERQAERRILVKSKQWHAPEEEAEDEKDSEAGAGGAGAGGRPGEACEGGGQPGVAAGGGAGLPGGLGG